LGASVPPPGWVQVTVALLSATLNRPARVTLPVLRIV
jgi:hypothetical protein